MKRLTPIDRIVQQYSNKIYWLAFGITHNEKDSEDILQNTLIKVIKNLHTFGNRSKLSTWIYSIAHNESLMYLRNKKRQLGLQNMPGDYFAKAPYGLIESREKPADIQLLDSELKNQLNLAIRNIPIKYRMPLLLHQTKDLSLSDCAAILRLSVPSVKTRVHRAYLMLRDQMGGYYNDRAVKKQAAVSGCSIWQKFIYDYAKDKFTKDKNKLFEEHIKDCRSCKDFLSAYKKAIQIVSAVQCQDIPAPLKDRLSSFLNKV